MSWRFEAGRKTWILPHLEPRGSFLLARAQPSPFQARRSNKIYLHQMLWDARDIKQIIEGEKKFN